MEADGRVQIDWGKEMWSDPEWLRLFGEQSMPSEHPPVQSQSTAEGNTDLRAAADGTGSDRLANEPAVSDQSYFAELPKVATGTQPGVATVTQKIFANISDTATAKLLGEDTTKLANAYAAAIRERNSEDQSDQDGTVSQQRHALEPSDQGVLSEGDTGTFSFAVTGDAADAETAKLTELDPTELLESEGADLSEESAARLLAADLTNLTEADLTNLTEADLVALTQADAAELAEANTAKVGEISRQLPTESKDVGESGQTAHLGNTMSGPRRVRRRASRR